jgi:phosphoglycerate kinase
VKFGSLGEQTSLKKTILLRLDLNSPIDPSSHLILDDKRFREHVPTIRALDESRLVIITHQSRPGKKDFTTLEAHAEKLSRLVSRPVQYVDDIFGRCAREAVRSMEPGEIVMLENVRFNAEENLKVAPADAKNTILVRRLAAMADLFVNDAFGTAHRSQPTVVGLPLAMKSAAGLLMEKEVSTLSRVLSDAPRPVTFVLGGTKVDDSLDVAENVLANGIADRVMAVGVVGNLFLMAGGIDIGAPSRQLIDQLGYTDLAGRAAGLLASHGSQVLLPDDVAVRKDGTRADVPASAIPGDAPVLDLGPASTGRFAQLLRESGTVVFNGPAGVFEEAEFAAGTFELLRAAADARFSVVGGGHTAAVIEKIGIEEKFSHISTGGGACIEFLTGKKLPAVAALEESKKIFG